MANMLDVAITTMSCVGSWLDEHSGQNHPELKVILRPEVATRIRPFADTAERLRSNLHRHILNSNEDMELAAKVFSWFNRYVEAGRLSHIDSRLAVAFFAQLYLHERIIPFLKRKFGEELFMVSPNYVEPQYEIKKFKQLVIFFVAEEGSRQETFTVNDNESVEDAFNRWLQLNRGNYYDDIEVTYEVLEKEKRIRL